MPPFAKREIKNSFIKLLTERPISQITVKDIVEDCGVNRNSFYYHFQPSLVQTSGINDWLCVMVSTQNYEQIGYHSSLTFFIQFYHFFFT